jgi:hypothetical protein
MDLLSSLPLGVLGIVHHMVIEAGGLQGALALEATSKQLQQLCRAHVRFQQEVLVTCDEIPDLAGSSFWDWLETHGSRVDRLALHDLDLALLPGPLFEQPGVAEVGVVSLEGCAVEQSFQPLRGLANLEQMECCVESTPSEEDLESNTGWLEMPGHCWLRHMCHPQPGLHNQPLCIDQAGPCQHGFV